MATNDVHMQDPSEGDQTEPEPLMEAVEENGDANMDGNDVHAPITETVDPAAEKQAEEEDSMEGSHTWDIHNVTHNKDLKRFSEPFMIGGYPWRILVFPRGNRAGSAVLSAYLDCGESQTQPINWTRRASFKLSMVNQRDHTKTICKGMSRCGKAAHQFSAQANDWGFTAFANQQDIFAPNAGFLVNDTLRMNVVVRVERPEDLYYDSKKSTGYVGLKNQGATCYMNSLLQTLYNINYFRQLQFGDTSVSTKDLTKSFGWDTMEGFMQHDVQELNRVLCDNLEEKMKNTKVQGAISHLFEGHTVNFVECINVDYKSNRKESYMDLQLDVKGCKNVYDSFVKYTEVEMLDGQNQYKAEGHGLQDARKGVLFDDFPPVLQLQLKRFEYDFQRDMMVKINDRYEFPDELDLDVDDGKFLAPGADRSVRNLYKLHSVLVHSGGVHGGHYYAYIRPASKQWLKFDDEKVYKEPSKRALDEQFGGEDETPPPAPGFTSPTLKLTKYSNAYMLVYVRESSWKDIMLDVSQNDIAEHVRSRLKAEAEEKERRRKEKMEAHLYTIIKVARDEDFKNQIGTHQFFDLVDNDKVESFRVKKQTTLAEFKQMVAEKWGIAVEQQRFWMWATRQNRSVRPSTPLAPNSDENRVCDIREPAAGGFGRQGNQSEVRLYLEEGPQAKGLHTIERDELLSLLSCMNPPHPKAVLPGQVTEEIKFEPKVMIDKVDQRQTFHQAQLEHGDILVVQALPSPEEAKSLKYPLAKDYLDYVKWRITVHFKKLDNPKEEALSLELSSKDTYEEVSRRLAAALRPPLEDPLKLRFTQQNNYTQQPKPQAMRFPTQEQDLPDMLQHFGQTTDTLFYEVLDLPLPQLERLKTLKASLFTRLPCQLGIEIAFHGEKAEEVAQHQLRLPKDSCIEHVLEELRKLLPADYASTPLRLLQIYWSKIYKVFDEKDDIEGINDQYWHLRAEAVPEDQLSVSEQDQLMHVYHFTCDQQSHVNNFGDPFLLRVTDTDTLADIRPRIQQKLGIADEEFAKWKFAAIASLRPPDYLNDDDSIASKFVKSTSTYSSGQDSIYLGLEHTDAHPHRHRHHNNRLSHYERPVKIYN
ncbi:MAG: hypothetical protein FRX49_05656 [Trebouxia sp. A1-2]|nr:MAG: hypothetical protein FRX49_05656 [Trebouxia sp. A1-2]